MALDRFMIAPINGGLQTDIRPWIIPDDAFSRLNNAYIFRGRVRKRFGSRLMNSAVTQSVAQLYSRVRINLGNTPGPLSLPGNASQLKIGQMFSVGNDIFTVYQLGAGVVTLSTNSGATATINSTSNPNTVTFTGESSGTAVYYYPANPIMGFITYETATSSADPVFIFDTQFAYQYTSGAFAQLGTAVWAGSDSQFFWGTTWGMDTSARNLFVVNNNQPDQIKYWNGTTWSTFAPLITTALNAGNTLQTAQIVVVFKNRLVALNTTENINTSTNPGSTDTSGNASGTVAGGAGAVGDYFYIGNQVFTVVTAGSGALAVSGPGPVGAAGTFNTATGAYTFTGAFPSTPNVTTQIYFFTPSATYQTYTNRARWAAFGDPLAQNAWRQDVPGQGNALDAATMEDIVSCQFVKDRLIVFFERSTWELVYTGNQAQPFTWQKLNTELGAESTFSSVPFDKYCLTVGNVGIHSCNGVNVARIDDKIPDTVWSIHDGSTNIQRIYGIRDYYAEQVYWTFPNVDTNFFSSTYPNKILVYNYKTGSWAFNDDSITAFGYYYAATQSAANWSSLDITWNNDEITWDSGASQALNKQIIAGNQEGFVFIVDSNLAQNAPALQITNISIVSTRVTIVCVNHNLNVQDYIYIQFLNGLTGPFFSLYQVDSIVSSNSFTIIAPDILGVLENGGVYTGGGTITRLSQIDILTKQFNFYVQENRNATVQRVDFLVDRTPEGQFTVDYLTSTSSQGLLQGALDSGAIQGTGIVETTPYDPSLYPWEQYQDRLWHPSYLVAEGEAVQLEIYLSNEQMLDFSVVTSPFQLHAMTIYCQRTSDRLQ